MKGMIDHTSNTPRCMTADTYLTAAKMVMNINEIAERHSGLSSVAEIHV